MDRRETYIYRVRKDGLGCIERERYAIGLCPTAVARLMKHWEWT